MKKFRKVYRFQIVSIIIIVAFLLTDNAYPAEEVSSAFLRVPVDKVVVKRMRETFNAEQLKKIHSKRAALSAMVAGENIIKTIQARLKGKFVFSDGVELYGVVYRRYDEDFNRGVSPEYYDGKSGKDVLSIRFRYLPDIAKNITYLYTLSWDKSKGWKIEIRKEHNYQESLARSLEWTLVSEFNMERISSFITLMKEGVHGSSDKNYFNWGPLEKEKLPMEILLDTDNRLSVIVRDDVLEALNASNFDMTAIESLRLFVSESEAKAQDIVRLADELESLSALAEKIKVILVSKKPQNFDIEDWNKIAGVLGIEGVGVGGVFISTPTDLGKIGEVNTKLFELIPNYLLQSSARDFVKVLQQGLYYLREVLMHRLHVREEARLREDIYYQVIREDTEKIFLSVEKLKRVITKLGEDIDEIKKTYAAAFKAAEDIASYRPSEFSEVTTTPEPAENLFKKLKIKFKKLFRNL